MKYPPRHNPNKGKVILGLYDISSPLTGVYRDAGYAVIRFDRLRGQDVRLIEKCPFPVHGIISHSPCTHFAGSGARWWESKGEGPIVEGLSTIDATLRIVWVNKPKFWVLENPVGRLPRWIGRPRFIFQPHEFGGWLDPIGDEYTKRTCLWGEFTIPEKRNVYPRLGSPVRDKMSSQTVEGAGSRDAFPLGFSRAFFSVNK